ncbi:Bug family tripartite tricarboxylate transporter substrate binding protein [Roseiterribacter gracilis]|uniref:Tricarboxylate transporter n=1 Tax=Roseiterribacter gracilis TaxID=2812848 RepID=A0A8S8X8X1_9PROT|nr:tricarboxylate transporter [Rhodospirillales bacterium TMPK1]
MNARFVAALFGAACFASLPALAAWEPTKPVEFVVPAGAGGASDQMARTIQGIVQKYNLMKQPFIIALKGGASGAEGLMAMKQAAGDPHKIIVAQSSLYTIPFATNLPFSWKDLTPVTLMAMDEFVLWDNAELPYRTTAEFLAAAKKVSATEPMKMGGTGSKREDHILTAFIESKAGVKFAYIPYKSGGEAATQLVGKHTDANVNNPSENIAQWRANQVRALCVFDKERLPYKAKVTETQSWADIPTCKETGLDIDYLMLRGIFIPGGGTAEQVEFYDQLMRKVAATAEWKDYMEKNALKEAPFGPAALKAFLEKDEPLHKQLMTEAKFLAAP